jgi:hypothetical protein
LSEHDYRRAFAALESCKSAVAFFGERYRVLESRYFCHVSPIPLNLYVLQGPSSATVDHRADLSSMNRHLIITASSG